MKNKYLKILANFILIVCIIFVFSNWFIRIDLTSEKRYSLSNVSKEILKNLDDIVYIRVYLEGDLNIPFQRMKRSIREILDEFKAYAGNKLEYKFINPFSEKDLEQQKKILKELQEKGLKPVNIFLKEKNISTERIIFPGAIIAYKGTEVPVNFLTTLSQSNIVELINKAIQNVEFELISKINALTSKEIKKIAFIEGHGELEEIYTSDITKELSYFYQVDRGIIGGQPGIIDDYEAIIIAKPTKKFDEKDKYVIDQYIMKGGKVLWLLDMVNVNIDSLSNGMTFASISDLNLNDMLFRYGVRVNPVLIKDIQCNVIPVNTAIDGNPAKFIPAPWLYYPLLIPLQNNEITKGLTLIKSEFVNTIDTIEARKNIKKIPLIVSSKLSKIVKAPLVISLSEVADEIKIETFKPGNFLTGVLLEGEFESIFKNRPISSYFPNEEKNFIAHSVPTKMIIITDGDIIKNEIRYTRYGMQILPLGLDKYSQQYYDNKNLIINAINYLVDKEGIFKIRRKEFKLRLLDQGKIKKNRLKIQIINLLLPILLISIFGIIYNIVRQKKYLM